MTNEEIESLTPEQIEEWLEVAFEENYQRLRADGGHALTPFVKDMALRQVKAYYRKLRDVAENVTDTEVRLTLPEQTTPDGRKYTIEGVVDIVREEDRTVMYDIKTHEADFVRKNLGLYESQLNVYGFIWQNLRGQALDETAVIATAFPDKVTDALRAGNHAAAERQMELWDPLVPIPMDQGQVDDTIAAFGVVVDAIEGKRFKPPAVEKLMTEADGAKGKFGTRVCRNCDARFSCLSYRNFATTTNARTGIDFKTYYSDFGSDDERIERASLTLDVAPPIETENL